jgi:hypothetical protein
MIFATVVMLFQVSAMAPALNSTSSQLPVPGAEAGNQPSTTAFLIEAESSDTTKPLRRTPSLFDRDNVRLLPAEESNSKILAAEDAARMNSFENDAENMASTHIPEHGEALPALPDIRTDVRRSSNSWLLLALAQHGAATFDAWTTNRALARGYTEENPLLRPVAGSAAIYGVIQIGPALLDYVGRRMRRSESGLMRRTWWLPQTLGMSASLFAGTHNLIQSH